MENKRYQVFVSSTYRDLPEARQAVLMTLLTMDCLPAGMELFGAVDEEQFEFIKSVIDDSDYYVLIIGGRYGTEAPDGKGYTEKEYDYAVKAKKTVLAFVHSAPGKLELDRSESEPEQRKKLETFKAKVMKGRLVEMWDNPEQLPGKLSVSLNKAFRTHPSIGWVRGDLVASVQALTELNDLRKAAEATRKEAEKLREELTRALAIPDVPNIAGLDEDFEITGHRVDGFSHSNWTRTASWRQIFRVVGPHLTGNITDQDARGILEREYAPKADSFGAYNGVLSDSSLQTVKVQLVALKLVELAPSPAKKGAGLLWYLTPAGTQLVHELLVVRSKKPTIAKRRKEPS